ncbi:type II secretion system protein GspD [Halioglobus maricola]|uniref:Type II secretion system protein GspD n=1 Tax=Halioglobus maricola TaxID=2601894 RepID=A0A5P9NHK3_9GAMM|nr:type II secretion system secretin GspD [Halioglobus maricola]QFU75015.1 type II secretion system protein GspD [Halioglobus maricola]
MRALFSQLRIPLGAVLLALAVTAGPSSAQDFTVNLKETDIQELIKFVAEVTGTTIVVDPAVKGKVKVVSSKPVSRDELYDLFLSILEVHGYTAVRSGGVVRVIPSKDARSSPVSIADESRRPADEYVTQVIRLDNISAAKLIPVLRPLVPQQAHMAAYAPSNAIIISDVSANIDRIRGIIERMDNSAVQQTDIIQLRYAVAEDVVSMIDQLSKSEAKQSGGAEPEMLLVADSRTNSVLVTGDELERARAAQLIRHLDTPLEQSGNVKVVYLEYAQATEIAEVLTRVMQNIDKLDEGEGKRRASGNTSTIEADEGTNALIITADADEMAALEAVIHRLDIRRAQVLVEAIIVEMTASDAQELGLQWLFANDGGFYGSNINSQSTAERLAGAITPPDDGDDGDSGDGSFSSQDLAGALAGIPGMSLGWGSVDDDLTMTVVLNALKTAGNANILSTPSLLTLDNQEAYITVGQNVPFITGSYTNTGSNSGSTNPFQTIERENVGITLSVTPRINEGNSVVLDIEQEVSNVIVGASAISDAADLITSERKIQTTVLANDNQIVVLGGLIEDSAQDGQQKVPILGDIPFLGRLFRSDAVEVDKTNLLIFIRPTIIRDDAQMDGATAEKYRYIRDQQLLRREQGLMFLDDGNLPVLPEWDEQIKQLEQMTDEAAPGDG